MDAWTQALIDYGVLLSVSTLATAAYIVWKGEPNTPLKMLGAALTNGAVGAGLGICAVEKWGVRWAMAIGSLVGAGIVERKTLKKFVVDFFAICLSLAPRWLKARLGIHDDAN